MGTRKERETGRPKKNGLKPQIGTATTRETSDAGKESDVQFRGGVCSIKEGRDS